MTATEQLIEDIESLKNVLVARATGEGADEAQYIMLRRAVVADVRVQDELPRFVRTCRTLGEFWGFIKPKFRTYAERREFLREAFDPVLNILESKRATPGDTEILASFSESSLHVLQEIWRKALERRYRDPEAAITSARTLLETVCKLILDDLGVGYDEAANLPALYRATATNLGIAPAQHTEQVFKQILGGCQAVVEGLGALRNRLSDAHGRGRGAVKPLPRHAALAVNLAGGMAMYLVETMMARKGTARGP